MNQFYKDNPPIPNSNLDRSLRRIIYHATIRQIYRTSETDFEREERCNELAEELGLLEFKRKDSDRISRER